MEIPPAHWVGQDPVNTDCEVAGSEAKIYLSHHRRLYSTT